MCSIMLRGLLPRRASSTFTINQAISNVLLHAEARSAYDNGMRAILQKKATLDAMTARRRKLVEELHEREEAAKRQKMDEEKGTSKQ
ncbi:hypothetical protein B0H65DRAFT_549443 [Neurospora tetraspora]|uniref:Uncharacterized protein n=1 Tax=Neurospora tetraspora TaxID=94610 RepID=A0AAE0JG72_9PEZI|nr:hypothetical protein B0H65DRAFT_549443 [Neurospora tetraspora]